jgi:hypothetical protein
MGSNSEIRVSNNGGDINVGSVNSVGNGAKISIGLQNLMGNDYSEIIPQLVALNQEEISNYLY